MLSKRTLWLGVLAFVLVMPVVAQQAPPEGGEPKAFNLPETTTFELDNGLQATLVEYGALPKVTVNVIMRTGNINEGPEQVWLADLTGDLLKEGTTSRSATQIAQEAARMGGSVNIGVGLDQTFVNGDVLSEFGPDLVALMADVLQHPAFPESEVERLKRDRLRTLGIQTSQPQSQAMAKFRSEMYGDHPYGRIFPTEVMLQRYTLDDIQAFYDANAGAARTHVYVSGKFNKRAMERAIRDAFGDWEQGAEVEMVEVAPQSERVIHIVDQPGAAQSNVYIGLPVIDPSQEDYVALQVTNALLGGSFGSRITSNIREDKGYTYSPFSQVSTRYRDAYWAEVAAITTDVTGPAIQEIFNEIERLREEPPPQEELEGIQNYLAGTFVLQNSSRGGIINQLAFLDLHGLPKSYLTNYVQNVYAVTPEEVQRIAQEYLRPEDMLIVIAGDKSKVQPQVSGFGQLAN
jgi:predicted Zn-dependent peptidase